MKKEAEIKGREGKGREEIFGIKKDSSLNNQPAGGIN